jgi:hypothetical protein
VPSGATGFWPERPALWLGEDAAREPAEPALEDALRLVHHYAECGSPKYGKAANAVTARRHP